LLELLLRSVFDAADAAREEVTFAGALRWDKADPAADFAVLLVLLFLSTFDAAEAALLPVTSFRFGIRNSSSC